MYEAIDVANYIVNYLDESDSLDKLNNLKLQKILYYIEGRYLYEKNEPFFKDDIEKWKHGPVYSDVYHRFKGYGANSIKEPAYTLKINDESDFYSFLGLESPNQTEITNDTIDSKHEVMIRSVVDALINKHPFDLVDLTHNHPQWLEDESDIIKGKRNLRYDKQKLMYEFKDKKYRVWED